MIQPSEKHAPRIGSWVTVDTADAIFHGTVVGLNPATRSWIIRLDSSRSRLTGQEIDYAGEYVRIEAKTADVVVWKV